MGKSPLFLFSFFGIQQNHHVFCFRLSCWTVFLGPESTWNFHNIGIRRGRFWYGWSPDMWEEHYGMTREKNMAKNIRWLCMKIDENRFSNRYISCIGLYWIICIYIYYLYITLDEFQKMDWDEWYCILRICYWKATLGFPVLNTFRQVPQVHGSVRASPSPKFMAH